MNQQLFYNGNIITMTKENTSAMIIQDGIIQAVGSEQSSRVL